MYEISILPLPRLGRGRGRHWQEGWQRLQVVEQEGGEAEPFSKRQVLHLLSIQLLGGKNHTFDHTA